MIKSKVRLYELIIHLSHLHRRCTRLEHFWRGVTRSQVRDEGAPVVGSCRVKIRVRDQDVNVQAMCLLSPQELGWGRRLVGTVLGKAVLNHGSPDAADHAA